MSIFVKMLPAANGDCFLIKIKDQKDRNILIDGGKGIVCHHQLKEEFKELKDNNSNIDLLILTHIDDDHISGIIRLYQDEKIDKSIIKDVWFNSGEIISNYLKDNCGKGSRGIVITPISRKMSVRQGMTLEKEIEKNNHWSKDVVISDQIKEIGDMKIKVLSPDLETINDLNDKWERELLRLRKQKSKERKMSFITDYHKSILELNELSFQEDTSIFNKSSIAILLEYERHSLLMLGDSHPSIIISSLKNLGYSESNKLKVDLVKVSHHGSKRNTNTELLNMLDCTNYLISTDGSKHGLPNKESLAKIICTMNQPINFYFNYSNMRKIFSQEECEHFNINCFFLSEENDYTVEVK
ncbi:ComEC/Rec2 family competence protein [Bacillus taeanensis]|uniref:MBL fold protein n=1 Tax=Bacillus taeanensis TaxID=273032 RepID=A0A366XPD1_9BACI|nr:MBL fold metallo-hydrolase [Bacillus taeanensis]RBW68220.1 MBL fold protein [Bacillus taeanensis]